MINMNNKGFTLIELLAVVVIIGLIMGIAIPNTVTMIDKHKMNSYLEDARTFSSCLFVVVSSFFVER